MFKYCFEHSPILFGSAVIQLYSSIRLIMNNDHSVLILKRCNLEQKWLYLNKNENKANIRIKSLHENVCLSSCWLILVSVFCAYLAEIRMSFQTKLLINPIRQVFLNFIPQNEINIKLRFSFSSFNSNNAINWHVYI